MSNTVVGTVKDLTEEVKMRNPRTWTINLVFMTSRGVVMAPVIAPAKICFLNTRTSDREEISHFW